MSIQKQLQKAMIDENIKYARQVSELSKVSYKRTLAVLNAEPQAYLKDAQIIGEALGVNLAYIKLGVTNACSD